MFDVNPRVLKGKLEASKTPKGKKIQYNEAMEQNNLTMITEIRSSTLIAIPLLGIFIQE